MLKMVTLILSSWFVVSLMAGIILGKMMHSCDKAPEQMSTDLMGLELQLAVPEEVVEQEVAVYAGIHRETAQHIR